MEERLDIALYNRGLARSRSASLDLIKRGRVSVNGKPAIKANQKVTESDVISLSGGESFVSRAGEKLDYALKNFGVEVEGLTVLDIGSSTGGFTDCLLRRKAKKVIAVDVGRDQMDETLRDDGRVELHEKTDIRDFTLQEPVGLVVADLSFISLESILPKIYNFLTPKGTAILLVKPQFEVGKEIADKEKGIIRDEKYHLEVLAKIRQKAEKTGFKILGESPSPIEGEKGNKEFLILAQK